MKFKGSQMVHSYKFYSFLSGIKVLKLGEIYVKNINN